MMTQIKDIAWDDWTIAIPAFLTITLMPFTYSITNGIGAGVIAFVLLQAAAGKVREVNPLLWIVAALFLGLLRAQPDPAVPQRQGGEARDPVPRPAGHRILIRARVGLPVVPLRSAASEVEGSHPFNGAGPL